MDEILANAYIKGASDLLLGKIKGMPKVLPIPDNATNGDMIKAMFPNEEIIETDGACVYVGVKMRFDKDWWNAPYKREVK